MSFSQYRGRDLSSIELDTPERAPSHLYTDPAIAAKLLNPAKRRNEILEKWYETAENLMAFSKTKVSSVLRPPPVEEPWNVNDKTATSRERMAKYKFFASARLRYKARTMIGATGSRHIGQRRRASIASASTNLPSMLSTLEGVAEADEGGRSRPVTRRRVVDTSDLRTCAILQTRLKEIKTYPE
nr:hypothetical protein BaRGS_020820 [Batillaria attramentaria]